MTSIAAARSEPVAGSSTKTKLTPGASLESEKLPVLKKSDSPKVSRAPSMTVSVRSLLSIAKDSPGITKATSCKVTLTAIEQVSPPLEATHVKSGTAQSPNADKTRFELKPIFSVVKLPRAS